MRIPRVLAVVVAAALAASAWPALAQSPRTDLAPVSLPEIPNSVAIADTGVALVSFHDLGQVGLVSVDGTLTQIDVGCEPSAVEISPGGDVGWAVCQASTHLIGIDIASGVTFVADESLETPIALVYSPDSKQVVIGGASGQITVVSVTSPDDYLNVRSFSIGGTVPGLTLSRDGSIGFAATAPGRIVRFDVRTGVSQTLTMTNSSTYVSSLSLSPSGSFLYAGGAELADDFSVMAFVLLKIDPSTGRTLQRVPLTTASSGFGQIIVAAAHRTLYVGSAIGAGIGSTMSGVMAVHLDPMGEMGTSESLFDTSQTVNSMELSRDGRMLAVGSVQAQLLRVSSENVPYPPSMTVSGKLKRSVLAISGQTTGVATGTKVTVFVKVLGKRGARFIAQKSTAVVSTSGSFRWTGKTTAKKVAVYARAGAVTSPTITITSS